MSALPRWQQGRLRGGVKAGSRGDVYRYLDYGKKAGRIARAFNLPFEIQRGTGKYKVVVSLDVRAMQPGKLEYHGKLKKTFLVR